MIGNARKKPGTANTSPQYTADNRKQGAKGSNYSLLMYFFSIPNQLTIIYTHCQNKVIK